MIQKLWSLYSEALAGITPWIKSKKHHEYSDSTKHIREESKWIIQKILGTFGFNKKINTTEEKIELSQKEELIKALLEAKQAVDTALDKNTVNLRTDLLDIIPVFAAKTWNPWMILAGIIGFWISVYWSYNEFIYRLRELNPKMREAKTQYSRFTGTDDMSDTKMWYRDVALDTAETAVEWVSFFLPSLIFASNLMNFLIELPLDASSRNKYYKMWDEVREMYDEIQSQEKKDS